MAKNSGSEKYVAVRENVYDKIHPPITDIKSRAQELEIPTYKEYYVRGKMVTLPIPAPSKEISQWTMNGHNVLKSEHI